MTYEYKDLNLLESAFRHNDACFLGTDSLTPIFETRILNFDESKRVLDLYNSVPYSLISKFMSGTIFSLRTGVLKYQSHQLSAGGDRFRFQLEGNGLIYDDRHHERQVSLSRFKWCQILNPYDLSTLLNYGVIECTEWGMSLLAVRASLLFERQTKFEHIKLISETGDEKIRQGQVAYCRNIISIDGKNGYQIGIRFS